MLIAHAHTTTNIYILDDERETWKRFKLDYSSCRNFQITTLLHSSLCTRALYFLAARNMTNALYDGDEMCRNIEDEQQTHQSPSEFAWNENLKDKQKAGNKETKSLKLILSRFYFGLYSSVAKLSNLTRVELWRK